MQEYNPRNAGEHETRYDGGQVPRRQNKIYERDGAWHWEPEMYRQALRSSRLNRITIPNMLLVMMGVYQGNSFRCLDLRRIIRSSSMRGEILRLWDIFLEYGIKACSEHIRRPMEQEEGQRKGSKNYDRYFSVIEPLDSYWRQHHARVMADGVQRLIDADIPLPAWLTRQAVLDGMTNEAFVRRLKLALRRIA